MSGLLIALDSVDGAGKTTFSRLTEQYLWKKYGTERVLLTQHPGATGVGKELRKLIKDPNSHMDKITERLLFAADNCAFLNMLAKPALENNRIVISDRYWSLTDIVYGIASGVPIETMLALHAIVSPLPLDLLMVFRCPWSVCRERKVKASPPSAYGVKADCRIEARGDEYLEKIAAQYESIQPKTVDHGPYLGAVIDANTAAHRVAKRIVCIDANQDWDAVREEVFGAVDKLIEETQFK